MIKLLVVALLLVGGAECKSKFYGDLRVSKIRSVYDGDTFRVDLEGIMPAIFGRNIAIRVNGVDAPEIRGKCRKEKILAKEARDYVRNLLVGRNVRLRDVGRDKYFRIDADVYVDGNNLAGLLINAGLGVPYYGGHKSKNWCE